MVGPLYLGVERKAEGKSISKYSNSIQRTLLQNTYLFSHLLFDFPFSFFSWKQSQQIRQEKNKE